MTIQMPIRRPSQQEFEPIPEDMYLASINNVDEQENKMAKEDDADKMVVRFEFVIQEAGDFHHRKLWAQGKPTLFAGSKNGNPSTLYNIFCAVRGKKLTEEECDVITTDDVNTLVGKELRLVVKQKMRANGPGMKNIIADFLPLKNADRTPDKENPSNEVNVSDIPF